MGPLNLIYVTEKCNYILLIHYHLVTTSMKPILLSASFSFLFYMIVLISFSAVIQSPPASISASYAFIQTPITNSKNDTNQQDKVESPSAEELKQLEGIFVEDQQDGPQSGCYIKESSIIGFKFKRAMVPLRSIKYDLQIVNSLAHVTLQQEYENPSKRFLNVYYSFPIRPDSALYRFTAEFDNVVIEGVVKEKQQARREFQKAKSEGRQVALGELNVQSKDIINLQIGNIPPKAKVKIIISFVQEMVLARNMFYSIQVPSTISPRYMNSVPSHKSVSSASKQGNTAPELPSPSIPRSQAVSANPGYTWDFQITLKTTRKLVFSSSPTHKIVKDSYSGDGLFNRFSLDKEAIPNKDFVFLYTPEDFDIPDYVVGYSGNTTTVLVSFIPKFSEAKSDDAYQDYKANKQVEFNLNSVRGEYIFILDRSGSMQGDRMERAKQALIVFLRSLPQDSYFNIISFGWSFQKMYAESVKYENKNIKDSIEKVKAMGADFGGTEIFQPLQHALQQPVVSGYPRFIFLLTDGTVENTEGVVQMARQKSRNARISSIGIGNGASTRLIEGTAEAGRGKFVMISDSEDPSTKIISLLESSLTPLITKINLEYDQEGLQSVIPNPKKLPYILKDSIVNFYLTYEGELTEPKKVSLEYQDSVSKKTYRSEIEVKAGKQNHSFVDKMAHFKVLRALENLAKDSQAVSEEQLVYRSTKDFAGQATEYSVKYQILSEYTSFLAVGKELVDKEKKLFKELGTQLVEIVQTKPIEYQDNIRPNTGVSSSSLFLTAPSPPPTSLSQPLFSMSIMASAVQQDVMAPMPAFAVALEQPVAVEVFEPIIAQVPESIVAEAAPEDIAQPTQTQQSSAPTQTSLSSKLYQQSKDIASVDIQQPVQSISLMPSIPAMESFPAENSNQTQKKPQKLLTVQQLINNQNSDGSWNNESLVAQLAKDAGKVDSLIKTIGKAIGKDIVITKLALLWLEKQQVEMKYQLIIKKAKSWLAKSMRDAQVSEDSIKDVEVV